MPHLLHLNKRKNGFSDNDEIIILAFFEYLFTQLVIKKPVTIKLETSNEENVNASINVKLAHVELQNRLVVIYCKERGILDVLRSIAHELIHVQQNDLGQLTPQTNIPFYLPSSDIPGYEFEYEAYGLSGIIVRNFRALLNEENEQE